MGNVDNKSKRFIGFLESYFWVSITGLMWPPVLLLLLEKDQWKKAKAYQKDYRLPIRCLLTRGINTLL